MKTYAGHTINPWNFHVHFQVGAVVSIGLHKSRKAVDWSLVKNIAAAWFITLPVSGILSAIAMKLLLLTI